MGTKIGVYGTLKKGFRANDMLSNATFKGSYRVSIPFIMYNVGCYPALIKIGEKLHSIYIEIYEVDDVTLQRLDRYEGYPNLYQKSVIKVNDEDVIIYTMDSMSGFLDRDKIIKSGNWK